jgi:hypothetical protein
VGGSGCAGREGGARARSRAWPGQTPVRVCLGVRWGAGWTLGHAGRDGGPRHHDVRGHHPARRGHPRAQRRRPQQLDRCARGVRRADRARADRPGGLRVRPAVRTQAVTAGILVLAANTAFNGFPVLASLSPAAATCRSSSTGAGTGSSSVTGSSCSRWPPARSSCSTATSPGSSSSRGAGRGRPGRSAQGPQGSVGLARSWANPDSPGRESPSQTRGRPWWFRAKRSAG